jgi:carbonic anhydrase
LNRREAAMVQKVGSAGHDALVLLKEGNARYVCGKTEGPNRTKGQRLAAFEQGQHPFAGLVSCSDSRVPPEIIFDRGLGDIFVIRVAGNICGISEMGSIEYAVEHLQVPLFVVMGHSKCGAVSAVVNEERMEGNLSSVAQRIAPAVKKTLSAKSASTGPALVDECARENVWRQIETLIKESSVVRNAVADGSLEIVGAFYDMEFGDVNWMGKHPNEQALLKRGSGVQKPDTKPFGSEFEPE